MVFGIEQKRDMANTKVAAPLFLFGQVSIFG